MSSFWPKSDIQTICFAQKEKQHEVFHPRKTHMSAEKGGHFKRQTSSNHQFSGATGWAPTSYKWGYNPYKWPYKWATGVVTPLIGVITPFITGRGPSCISVFGGVILQIVLSVDVGTKAWRNVKRVNIEMTAFWKKFCNSGHRSKKDIQDISNGKPLE